MLDEGGSGKDWLDGVGLFTISKKITIGKVNI
jgi:hypothetical protein